MSRTDSTDDAVKAEMLAAFARAGVSLPQSRMKPVLAGYKELREMCDLLRQPRAAASEPANSYSLVTLMKGQ